jgi:plasmid stabilization system protein ParE
LTWKPVSGFGGSGVFYRFTGRRLEILRLKHGAMDFPQALRQD